MKFVVEGIECKPELRLWACLISIDVIDEINYIWHTIKKSSISLQLASPWRDFQEITYSKHRLFLK